MKPFWIWENVAKMVRAASGQLKPSVLLHRKIDDFSITRNESHRLTLTTISPRGVPDPIWPDRRLGEVHRVDDELEISSVHACGHLVGVSRELIQSTGDIVTSTYNILRFDLKFHNESDAKYTFDWVSNTPLHYIWLGGHSTTTSKVTTKTFHGGTEVKLVAAEEAHGMGNQSVRLRLAGFDICLGVSHEVEGLDDIAPGFILYVGNPDTSVRETIRNSLSFALGSPLVYFGSSTFDVDFNPISIEAVTPHTMGGLAWNIQSQPPTPITDGSHVIAPNLLEAVASAFIENNLSYDFKNILWRKWYADVAPYYMAPAYYGSLIESIQKAYTQNPESKVSSTIINKSAYRKNIKLISKYIAKQNIDIGAKALLQKKLENANSAPQKLVSQRFYESLDLVLGDLELKAWDRRNDAAHGNAIPEGGELGLIRETKILKVMLNRIMLRILKAGGVYVDYYSFDHPTKNLSHSIMPNEP